MKIIFVCLLCIVYDVNGFIVPDEVPTLLSLIYSNIPTLKKGTDSRLGWGFRLGDRADFQVLLELGPQKETAPLGNQQTDSTNKRNVINNLANTLYAQRNKEKQQQQQISNTEGGKYLEQWKESMIDQEENVANEPTRINLGIGEVDAKDYIKDDATIKLEELYNNKTALDNVDLEN